MSVVFSLLLILVIVALFWALISPKSLAKRSNKNFTRKHFGLGFGVLAIVLLALIGITAPKQTATPQSVQLTTVSKTQPAAKPTTTQNTVTQTKSVLFTSSTVQDASLAQGTTKVTTQGVNGVETLTYQDTDTNGKQTAQKLVSDVITTEPINQVTSVGTYVAPTPTPTSTAPSGCTNGTYVNSSGNTVCSPETSLTVPAGATAQCVDGTYSFSQHRSGTCSYHGGVAEWLN